MTLSMITLRMMPLNIMTIGMITLSMITFSMMPLMIMTIGIMNHSKKHST